MQRRLEGDRNADSETGTSRWTVPVLVGLVAGAASGLLGVGGGIVMVPLLTLFAGLSQHRAHATSLAAIVPIAVVSGGTFAVAGEVDYRVAAALAVGAIIGAPLGANLMSRTGEGLLKTMFGILLLAVSVQLLWP